MKELFRYPINSYRETLLYSGIYKITCSTNGTIYIGSAVEIYGRWYNHLYTLTRNKHINTYLQRSWNKYGPANFTFEVIEQCEKDQCIIREQHYLDTLLFAKEFIAGTDNRFIELGFNNCPTAYNTLGRKRSKNEISIMRDRAIQMWQDQEMR